MSAQVNAVDVNACLFEQLIAVHGVIPVVYRMFHIVSLCQPLFQLLVVFMGSVIRACVFLLASIIGLSAKKQIGLFPESGVAHGF